MKKIFALVILIGISTGAYAQYNPLWIPDTLSGTTFDLTIRDTFRQIVPGNQTITAGVNGDFWGPTLIMNKWDVVHPVIHNQMADTTTIHWHGMHLPAIMDGGPHQTIPPYSTWNPYWQVINNAATLWYHPHLDMKALEHLIAGVGGFIIIHDSAEAALNLPRTYGVDDIPVVFADRKLDASNQFIIEPYGDTQLANGVLHAAHTVPAQLVRFRLLGGATERFYNLGFSDNRPFYVIATDGGFIDTPVTVTRLMLNEGERYEILADFGGQAGTAVDIIAYNTELDPSDSRFNMLHLNVGAPTAAPVTVIPHHLTTNVFYDPASSVVTRQLLLTDSFAAIAPDTTLRLWGFKLNKRIFNRSFIDYTIPINRTEIWQLNSNSFVSHPFHIHDVLFYVLSIDGAPAPAYMQGWKDVVRVPANKTVRFITRFTDFSDSLHPYMFHCHIAMHEDDGMMGQFVVGKSPAGLTNLVRNSKMNVFPNPAQSVLNFEMSQDIIIRHATVINTGGHAMKEIEVNASKATLDLADLPKGLYYLRLTDAEGGTYIKAYLMQ